MGAIRDLGRARIVLVSTALLSLGIGTALAKVGFDDFTASQQAWFWEKLDNYAYIEALARFCGETTNFEQRMVAAARECATDKAIETARSVFRRKVAGYTKGKSKLLCGMAADARRVGREAMVEAVRDVTAACRSCTTCK